MGKNGIMNWCAKTISCRHLFQTIFTLK